MTETDYNYYEDALKLIQNHKYEAAAQQLDVEEDMNLKGELENLSKLVGRNSELVGGQLGRVLSNYEVRLIEELSQKAEEHGDQH